MPDSDAVELDAEDAKIVTLARAARARTGAAEGAAVRDTDGRTYVGCTVDLPALRLTAVQTAVAAAVAAGATGLEAAVVITGASTVDDASSAVVAGLGAAAMYLVDPAGAVRDVSADVAR